MKINICFKTTDNATGGGNQFLNAFKQFCMNKGCYEVTPEEADVILFNSHQYIPETIKLKIKNPSTVFVHRIDGPIRLYNSISDKRDFITKTANKILADAVVFQSKWSRVQNLKLGFSLPPFDTIILNSSDQTLFNNKNKTTFSSDRKIRLIASSWSNNWKKGFEVYRWLDQNLDFSFYEMTFIGNSPIKFNNIHHIQPLSGKNLGAVLGKHDIYITASQKDPCSNSLIEALQCGLPSIVLNDGGHPEIVGGGGELFRYKEEIPELILKIKKNYEAYQKEIHIPSMEEIGDSYIKFFNNINDEVLCGNYRPKELDWIKEKKLKFALMSWKIHSKLKEII